MGLLFGAGALSLLRPGVFPNAVLGCMLGISGLELAMSARDVHDDANWAVGLQLFVTATATIAYGAPPLPMGMMMMMMMMMKMMMMTT